MRDDLIDLDDLGRMRAVMHPARWQVLRELYAGGSLTATQAAQRTGLTPSAMSYHLQQLAKTGLVVREASADGRERPWRAVGPGFTMSAQPDAAVGATMMRNLLSDVARLLATPPPEAPASRPWPVSFSHAGMKLSRETAKELHERIAEVMAEFEEGRQDDDAVQYDLFWIQGVGEESAEPQSHDA